MSHHEKLRRLPGSKAHRRVRKGGVTLIATWLAGCALSIPVVSTSGGPPGQANRSHEHRPTSARILPAGIAFSSDEGHAGPVFHVDLESPTGTASAFVVSTNRNHVEEHFPRGAEKLARLRELRPRWGQGRMMLRIGHGPTDGRFDHPGMTGYHFEECWNRRGPYPYDDVRFALEDARDLGAEMLHVINYGTSTPDEAARLVRYLNDPDSPARQEHPIDTPPTRYFEIGNEISWSMVRGHAEHAPDEVTYARRALEFIRAMRAASPVPIHIGVVASTNSNWLGDGWSGRDSTVKRMLAVLGDEVDFLVYHGYPSWPLKRDRDLTTLMAQNTWNHHLLEGVIGPAIRQAVSHPVAIANTEFFTEQYDSPRHARGLFGTLYAADTVALAFRHGMPIANQFCLDHGDMADASYFIGDDPTRVTPIFRFQRLLAQHWGEQLLETSTRGVPTVEVIGSDARVQMPELEMVASRDRDTIHLMILHRTEGAPHTVRIAGLPVGPAVTTVLTGTSGWGSGPEEIQETVSTWSPDRSLTVPPASIMFVDLPIPCQETGEAGN